MNNLIFDRTSTDVTYAAALRARIISKGWGALTLSEQTEYLSGLRGSYNASDLNRVTAFVKTLADTLHNGYGTPVDYIPLFIEHEDGSRSEIWLNSDIPKPQELMVYLQNIEKVRSALPVFEGTPNVPADMAQLTYQEANDIEQLLYDVSDNLQKMAAAWYYSSEIYTGEVIT